MNKSSIKLTILPLFLGFFVMGFVDVVGVATSYVKVDFKDMLSAEYFGFLPSIALIWFLIIATPSAILMNFIGRKNTVLLSIAVTLLGMAITMVNYNLYTCLCGFAFLGIGNAILQVSLVPLLTNIVSQQSLASVTTAGQAIKALSSFAGPFIALYSLIILGAWQYIFPIFGGITLVFAITLLCDKIPREKVEKSTSILDTFALLGDRTILLLFLGIVAVVGVDMGMNMGSPMFLMDKLSLNPELEDSLKQVALVPSVYFACRTFGAFVGTALLAKIQARTYFKIHMLLSFAAILTMIFTTSEIALWALVGIIGYGISSIFAVIFSMALNARVNRQNEVSGLIITAVSGGAIVPPIMTWAAQAYGSEVGAMVVIAAAMCYLIYCAFSVKTKKNF